MLKESQLKQIEAVRERRVREVACILGIFRDATQKAYEKGEYAPEVWPIAREIVEGDYKQPEIAILDSDQSLPEGVFDYEQHSRIFKEAGFRRVICFLPTSRKQ